MADGPNGLTTAYVVEDLSNGSALALTRHPRGAELFALVHPNCHLLVISTHAGVTAGPNGRIRPLVAMASWPAQELVCRSLQSFA